MPELAIVILAAGESARFRGIKQLAHFKGKYLLQWSIDASTRLSEVSTYLVLGAHRESIETAIDTSKVKILFNPLWPEGIASSIRTGVSELAQTFKAILFIAGDQALITHDQIESLIQQWQDQPNKITAAFYKNNPGIPAIFPNNFYDDLLGLKGDIGAKKLLIDNLEQLTTVSLPQAAIDIDTQQDLNKY